MEAAVGVSSRRCPVAQTRSWAWGISHPFLWLFYDCEQKPVPSEQLPISSSLPTDPAWLLLLLSRMMFSQHKELGSAGRSSLPDVLDTTGQLFCSWGSAESSSSTFAAEEDQDKRIFGGKDSVVFLPRKKVCAMGHADSCHVTRQGNTPLKLEILLA